MQGVGDQLADLVLCNGGVRRLGLRRVRSLECCLQRNDGAPGGLRQSLTVCRQRYRHRYAKFRSAASVRARRCRQQAALLWQPLLMNACPHRQLKQRPERSNVAKWATNDSVLSCAVSTWRRCQAKGSGGRYKTARVSLPRPSSVSQACKAACPPSSTCPLRPFASACTELAQKHLETMVAQPHIKEEEEETIGRNALSRSDIGLSTHMGGSHKLTGRCVTQKHARTE